MPRAIQESSPRNPRAVAYFDGAAAPRAWGRRRGLPVRREVEVIFDREAGTPTVTKTIDFEGEFRANIWGVPYRIGEANLGTAN